MVHLPGRSVLPCLARIIEVLLLTYTTRGLTPFPWGYVTA
jgi:hypothetical protein